MTTAAKYTLAVQAERLNLQTEEELYNYIMESIINGQRRQAIELYNELPDEAKLPCKKHIEYNFTVEEYTDFINLIMANYTSSLNEF